jgi:hypothetical protein
VSDALLNENADRGSPTMPSDVRTGLSIFDRFATRVSDFVSRAWFFIVCVLLVLLWAPSYFLLPDVDTWQLIINTITTIVTFLLVALLQNTQKRADEAIQHKLNAIADGLADLMSQLADQHPHLETDRKGTPTCRRARGTRKHSLSTGDPLGGGDERDPVPGLAGPYRQPDGEVGLRFRLVRGTPRCRGR